MNRLGLMSLVVLLSTGLMNAANSQEAQKSVDKSKTTGPAQLQDQNQNQGTVQNHERNQVIHGPYFVDKDGDGFNDNAPDHDGDGIPNGQDPDYQGAGKGKRQQQFLDQDGDGIADNVIQGRGGRNYGKGRSGYGSGSVTGLKGVRPQDGTGYGPGAASGVCDGTGPKGRTSRSGQK